MTCMYELKYNGKNEKIYGVRYSNGQTYFLICSSINCWQWISCYLFSPCKDEVGIWKNQK